MVSLSLLPFGCLPFQETPESPKTCLYVDFLFSLFYVMYIHIDTHINIRILNNSDNQKSLIAIIITLFCGEEGTGVGGGEITDWGTILNN